MMPHDDNNLVKEYVLLPIVIKVLHLDRKWIQHSQMKLVSPYLSFIDQTIEAVEQKRLRIKKRMDLKRIHVYENRRTADALKVKYTMGNYHFQEQYRWDFVKAEVERRMNDFFNQTIK